MLLGRFCFLFAVGFSILNPINLNPFWNAFIQSRLKVPGAVGAPGGGRAWIPLLSGSRKKGRTWVSSVFGSVGFVFFEDL